MTEEDVLEQVYTALSPPERARVVLEAKLAGVLPDEWVREAVAEYGDEYDPVEAVCARIATIDMDETVTVEVEVGIDPPLFKRAWLRYEQARQQGDASPETFQDIMFDYVDFRPHYEVAGPMHDVEDLVVPCEEAGDPDLPRADAEAEEGEDR